MLADERAWEGAVLSTRNARQLYESAIVVNNLGNVGCASSLMVLSSEESAKAMSIGLHISTPKSESDIKRIFASHKYKHDNAAHFSSMFHLLIGLTHEPEKGKPRHGECGILNTLEEWRIKADSIKKNGFYVDYVNEEWLSPLYMAPEVFEKMKFQAETLLSVAEGFFLVGTLNELQKNKG